MQSMRSHQAALTLRRNVETQHVLMGDYVCSTLFGVLTHVQLARFMVRSWPYFPNAFTLARCIKLE